MDADTQNFINVLAEDSATAILGTNGGIDAIRFASGAAVAWRCPGSFGDHESSLAARAVRTVAKAHVAIAKVQADESRSESWKASEVERIATEAAAKFATERAEADKLVTDFAAADQRECQPPPLDRGDHVGAGYDREIRDEVRKLAPESQNELARELLEGKHPQTLAALLRSPWPLPGVLADALPEAWQRQLLASDPHMARQRQRAVQRVEWLRVVLEQSQAALPPRAPPTLAEQQRRALDDRAA